MSKMAEQRTGKYHISDYVEKLLCFNKVFCFKCRFQIDIGMYYEKGGDCGPCKTSQKYYHPDCYEKMFH